MPRFISALFYNSPFVNLPKIFGWFFFLALIGSAIWIYLKSKEYRILWEKRHWWQFAGLFLLTILGNLFLGIYVKTDAMMSWPGIPISSTGSALMVFGALGWMLAGGILGPLPAFILGMLAGVLRAPFDSHTIFTSAEFGLLALLFSIYARQRYRTLVYRALRQPIFAAIALTPIFGALFLVGVFFSASHPEITARLDFAINNTGAGTLAMLGEMLIAAVIAQIVIVLAPEAWRRKDALKPSPAEQRIETRFMIGMGTFIVALLLSLLIGDWIVAGKAARQMLDDRLQNTAQITAESVPFFLETGQNLGVQLSDDPALLSDDSAELIALLDNKIRLVPYFNQLFVVDASANILGEYPSTVENSRYLTQEETTGIILALSGIPTQIYTIPPLQSGDSALNAAFTIVDSISFSGSSDDLVSTTIKNLTKGQTYSFAVTAYAYWGEQVSYPSNIIKDIFWIVINIS